ncbi:MAG: OmpA family protein [Acidobacteriota bacterium]|nr:OmpA family protein [Acidobacteriota bacterium]
MNKPSGIGPALLLALAICFVPLRAQDDPGCKDHPMFTRLSDFYIDNCETSDFDSHEFWDKDENEIVFEGRKARIEYCLKEGGKHRSFLEIWRNYANVLGKMGGTVEFTNPNIAYIHLSKDDREVWVEVEGRGGDCYTLVIVEKKAMVQEITAGEMLDALNSQGFIALDIHFDVDQAVIKPESQPVVGQIAVLLKDNPQLAVSIEGHTDNTGAADHNKALSRQRAEAVVAALVTQGIDAKRMSAVGWGQEKPVADNRSDAGRAKNRRVEIVKK